MVLLYLIKGSPIDLMGHLMFKCHMVQMAFLLFIIPPLLICYSGLDLESNFVTIE